MSRRRAPFTGAPFTVDHVAAIFAINALLALGIAWRFVALRADWSAWNTAALAHATMAPRADLATHATAAPPPPVQAKPR